MTAALAFVIGLVAFVVVARAGLYLSRLARDLDEEVAKLKEDNAALVRELERLETRHTSPSKWPTVKLATLGGALVDARVCLHTPQDLLWDSAWGNDLRCAECRAVLP